MSRPLRLEFPGALYHVTARGWERRTIVRDDRDRQQWLDLFSRHLRLLGREPVPFFHRLCGEAVFRRVATSQTATTCAQRSPLPDSGLFPRADQILANSATGFAATMSRRR